MRFYHIGLCATALDKPNGMQKALMEVFSDYKEIHTGRRRLNDHIIFECSDFNPEIVFIQVQTPGIISDDTLRWMKSRGCFIINWSGDVRVPLPDWYSRWAEIIDLSLFTNATDVEIIRRQGHASDYLDIGIDPEIYNPQGDKLSVPEVVFMANDYGPEFANGNANLRREIVRQLEYLGPRFGVFGNGWPSSSGNLNHSQWEEAKAYRGARIAINCSHYDLSRYSSDRLLRIMASGCLCLTKTFPDLALDYTDGRHLRVWYDLAHLRELVDHYLKEENQQERLTIARQGCKYIHQKGTFLAFAKNLMQLINFYRR